MKFLPPLSSLALLGLAISLSACSTPANRRELYNQLGGNGPWHDYSRRLDASEKTGVAPADMGHVAGDVEPTPTAPGGPGGTTVVRGSRPTRQPKSAPLEPDPTALPSSQPPPAAPPANVPVPSSPTTPDSAIPAAPGGATTAPASDPASVPVNPPTT